MVSEIISLVIIWAKFTMGNILRYFQWEWKHCFQALMEVLLGFSNMREDYNYKRFILGVIASSY